MALRDEQGRPFSLLDDLHHPEYVVEFAYWLRAIVMLVALGVVAALSLACATAATATKPIEQRALGDIRAVDSLYMSTLQAVGALHNAKPPRIDDVAYARVLAVAEKVRVAREAAASALLAYLGTPPTSDDAGRARATLETALAKLAASALQLRAEVPTR